MVHPSTANSEPVTALHTDSAESYDASVPTHVDYPEKLSLWDKLTTVKVNPVNNKCTTLPILKLNSPYSINFHLYVYLCVNATP